VHDREFFGGVWVGVVFGRAAVRRPARVPDPDRALKRLARKPAFEVLQLALGAPRRELAVLERDNARLIVAAIFEPLEGVDELRRRRPLPDNPDNAAHPFCCSPRLRAYLHF